MRFPALRVTLAAALWVAASLPGHAQPRPTITFANQSGEPALVRVAGETAGIVSVPNHTSQTIAVRGGRYQIFVRYGEEGRYRYTRGEAFDVYEGRDGVEAVTITLHTVVNGNYGSKPSTAAEFGRDGSL